jgi:hypothetical protein
VAIELSRVTAMMDRRADAPPTTLTGPGLLHIGTSWACWHSVSSWPSTVLPGPVAGLKQ